VVKGNFGVKKSRAPLKNLKKYPRQKNNYLHFQNQGYIAIFMSQRERERERKRKIKRKRKRERISAGNYISKPPGPK
jgi:hypothetical protein